MWTAPEPKDLLPILHAPAFAPKTQSDDRRRQPSNKYLWESLPPATNSVTHSAGEYVRGETSTTNTVENFYSVFKRGMKGVYQHCEAKTICAAT